MTGAETTIVAGQRADHTMDLLHEETVKSVDIVARVKSHPANWDMGASAFADQALVNRVARASRPCGIDPSR